MNLGNIPDEFDAVYLKPGEKKMSANVDQKRPNAVQFTIMLEDHTMGQLIWSQLLTDPNVLYAGYKIAHPLKAELTLKIETTPESSPKKAFEKAIMDLQEELNKFEEAFHHKMTSYVDSQRHPTGDDAYM